MSIFSRTRSTSKFLLSSLFALALGTGVGACDKGDDDDGGGGGGEGYCSPENAANMCDASTCAFDPATIDCMAACANIAAICTAGDCDTSCQGQVTDATLCQAGCMGTTSLNCSNVTFGCYANNTSCEDVGACVNALQ